MCGLQLPALAPSKLCPSSRTHQCFLMTQVMQLEITSLKFAYKELGQKCVASRIRLQNKL